MADVEQLAQAMGEVDRQVFRIRIDAWGNAPETRGAIAFHRWTQAQEQAS